MKKPPHILLYNPDQYRGDTTGYAGNPAVSTPVLDSLVKNDAVAFRWAFCQNPVCTPSRCSFMTGWYPHVRGHRTMYHMLHPERGDPNLLSILKQAGYHVWWGGKNDLVPGAGGKPSAYDHACQIKASLDGLPLKPNTHNWTDWRGPRDGDNYYSFYAGKLPHDPADGVYLDSDQAYVEAAVHAIESHDTNQPLCIYLPLNYPHPPYGVEEPFYSLTDRSRIPQRYPTPDNWKGKPSILKGIWEKQRCHGWSEDRWSELRGVYYGMCSRIDHQLGIVIDALKRKGFYDDTALFFFSDHGDFTGDYGLVEKTQNTFEDVLTRVPFLFKPPAQTTFQPGLREELIELVDLSATIYDLVSIQPNYTSFGKSILPLLRGDTSQHRDAVFCEGGRRYGEEQAMEKSSVSFGNQDGLYWPRLYHQTTDEGPYHTKAAMCRTHRFKYVKRLYEQDEFYDLQNDPRELTNRIDDPTLKDQIDWHKQRMLRWYMETADVVPPEIDKRY